MERRLPDAFVKRMQDLLGAEYGAFLAEYEKETSKALFLLSDKLSPETFMTSCGFAVERIPHLRDGYAFQTDRPGTFPLHHAGAYYVQDPSAMATVNAAPLKRGMSCLDLCASPGGKTAQLAAWIGDEGFLVSNEINPSRCKTLCGNVERLGFRNVQITNADAKRIASWYPSYFDLTLVDAPCSGEGMFRKYENAPSEWSEKAVLHCAARQRELLREAAKTVRGGGFLLYSTCTFSTEENEETVRAFLEEHADFSLCPLPASLQAVSAPGVGLPMARRFYPHLSAGEGQFAALLQKQGDAEASQPAFTDARTFLDRTELDAVCAFLEDALPQGGEWNLCRVGKNLVAANRPAPRENLFSAGITLGTVENRRLLPHHQLFKALGTQFYRILELRPDDPRLPAYLSGAEIPCDLQDGWAAVTVCGCTLGGAKVSHGVAKNHYPKGLRVR